MTHLFESDGRRLLTSIDVARHAIRMGALLGLPIVGLLFWLVFVLVEFLRRSPSTDNGEQLVREVVYKEAPEMIKAKWSGEADYPSIDQFLRRLERERKVALTIEAREIPEDEEEDFEEHRVTVRLLVPREQLSQYELGGINTLMPHSWETTSDEVRKRLEGTDLDVMSVMHLLLLSAAQQAQKRSKPPWYLWIIPLVLFFSGVYWMLQESVRYNREPAILFGSLLACGLLIHTRVSVRGSLRRALLLLIPLAIMTGLMVFAHFGAVMPPGYYASSGLGLALLGTYTGILAKSATRDTKEVAQLARARSWLKNELKSSTPRLRDDAIPWLNALGLERDIERWRRRHQTTESRFASPYWTGNSPPVAEDEDWGGAF